MKEPDRIKECAIRAAREAGQYALKHMARTGKVSYKGVAANLVTDVDRRCEDIIIGRIRKMFPSHSILAEESGERISCIYFIWVIDHIDGTTNFAHGFPVFSVSIGVLDGEVIKYGVVYDPTRGEMFVAKKGEGAFLNGKKIKVSARRRLRDSLVATGFGYKTTGRIRNLKYFERMLRKSQAVRRAGSASIDLCYVACGRFDGFWELGLKPWDTASGVLMVLEAGGMITRLNGGSYNIFQNDILATNGKIHRQMSISLLK